MRELTRLQKKRLLENPNVLKVTSKNVVYTPEFKLKALDLYLNGVPPTEIFEGSGIPILHFPEDYCRHCLKRWKEKAEKEGKDSLRVSKRGKGSSGRPRTNLDNLSVEDLKSIIAVQEEFIAAIKKKKALAKKN